MVCQKRWKYHHDKFAKAKCQLNIKMSDDPGGKKSSQPSTPPRSGLIIISNIVKRPPTCLFDKMKWGKKGGQASTTFYTTVLDFELGLQQPTLVDKIVGTPRLMKEKPTMVTEIT
ncbi:hypothetical protein CHARACLAT_014388 [Characodon lateralis]|uniref:Uncharacterized protein n=1 Tax=Characodon lateralis TaxID=208331 RepID=A0ABU7D7E1_9TELE|nr:hypothetical protein [Characodon lateralis]